MSVRTLVRGGWVLTLGERAPNFAEADVLIDEGTVVEVGPGLSARGAEVVDATEGIVMPGFVDTHRHAWTSLLRNLGGGGLGEDRSASAADGRHSRPEDVYAATLIGLLGAVEAGITTVVDWSDLQPDEGHTTAALRAHADSGLRTVLVLSDPDRAKSSRPSGSSMPGAATGTTDPSTSLHTVAFGSGEPLWGDLDRIARSWQRARELGLRIHAHAGTAAARGVVSHLAGLGLLAEDVTLLHCSDLDDADLDAISSSGASVALAPASQMAGGPEMPPIQDLIDRGIPLSLGIGHERVAPGDMFAQMRTAISVQHALVFDLKLAGKAGLPKLLSTRDVIRHATLDGARAAGLGELTGSLEPGKQADIVILRTDRPNIFPINDPIGAVVWGVDTSNVEWVFVAGRPLMREGALQADVERARRLAMEARERPSAATGLLVDPTRSRR